MGKKRKRKLNWQRVQADHYYTPEEAGNLLNVHIGTIHLWTKKGMNVLRENKRHYLIMGKDLKDFLIARRQSRKMKLKIGEFYCFKCRIPRKSLPEGLVLETTEKMFGNGQAALKLRGICDECGRGLNLISTDKRAADWYKAGFIFKIYDKSKDRAVYSENLPVIQDSVPPKAPIPFQTQEPQLPKTAASHKTEHLKTAGSSRRAPKVKKLQDENQPNLLGMDFP